MPVALLLASYVWEELHIGRDEQFLGLAFTTGALVGRWWAPVPFAVSVAAVLAFDPAARAAIGWILVVVAVFAGVASVGVVARRLVMVACARARLAWGRRA